MHHFRVHGSEDTIDAEAGWNIFGGTRVGPGASVGGPAESESEGLSKSGHTLWISDFYRGAPEALEGASGHT